MDSKRFNLNKEECSNIAQNISTLFKIKGVSESKAAQDLNIPLMTLRRLTTGETTDPRISTLKVIADYFNVTIDKLIGTSEFNFYEIQNQSKPMLIPFFDWEQINSINTIALDKWKNWIPITVNGKESLNKQCFALESKPSMFPRYQPGTIFIFDPQLSPSDGDLVLIKFVKNNELSLRELFIDPPEWQLQPLNSGNPVLQFSKKEHEIVGIVILTLFYNRKVRI